jgi:hypothetical protein
LLQRDDTKVSTWNRIWFCLHVTFRPLRKTRFVVCRFHFRIFLSQKKTIFLPRFHWNKDQQKFSVFKKKSIHATLNLLVFIDDGEIFRFFSCENKSPWHRTWKIVDISCIEDSYFKFTRRLSCVRARITNARDLTDGSLTSHGWAINYALTIINRAGFGDASKLCSLWFQQRLTSSQIFISHSCLRQIWTLVVRGFYAGKWDKFGEWHRLMFRQLSRNKSQDVWEVCEWNMRDFFFVGNLSVNWWDLRRILMRFVRYLRD